MLYSHAAPDTIGVDVGAVKRAEGVTVADPNGRKLGKYRVYSLLGRGAAGTVYRARDTEARRSVAFKVLRAEAFGKGNREVAIQRMVIEAQAASALNHPNIVAVYDYRIHAPAATTGDDVLGYIVMELVAGRSLARHFQVKDRVGLAFALQVMAGLLAALEHAHGRGVIHRDVKPGNILLSVAGKVKLADFGLAHVEGRPDVDDGSPFGTLCYLAPERLRGEPGDARSDLFSAGAVFYEALTGQRAFPGLAAAVARRILNDHPVPPSVGHREVPKALDAVVAQALAKAPEARFASARAFADAIRAVVGESRWAEAVAAADEGSGSVAPLWNISQPEGGTRDWNEEPEELTTAPLRRILEQAGLTPTPLSPPSAEPEPEPEPAVEPPQSLPPQPSSEPAPSESEPAPPPAPVAAPSFRRGFGRRLGRVFAVGVSVVVVTVAVALVAPSGIAPDSVFQPPAKPVLKALSSPSPVVVEASAIKPEGAKPDGSKPEGPKPAPSETVQRPEFPQSVASPPVPLPVAPPLPLPKTNPVGMRHDQEFAAALALFRQSNLSAEAQAFQAFVAAWPEDPAAPEALFHLGEARLALGDPGQARDSFERLTEHYATSPQFGPGWVMLGIAESRLGRRDAACDAFTRSRSLPLPPWAAQRLAAERRAADCS